MLFAFLHSLSYADSDTNSSLRSYGCAPSCLSKISCCLLSSVTFNRQHRVLLLLLHSPRTKMEARSGRRRPRWRTLLSHHNVVICSRTPLITFDIVGMALVRRVVCSRRTRGRETTLYPRNFSSERRSEYVFGKHKAKKSIRLRRVRVPYEKRTCYDPRSLLWVVAQNQVVLPSVLSTP